LTFHSSVSPDCLFPMHWFYHFHTITKRFRIVKYFILVTVSRSTQKLSSREKPLRIILHCCTSRLVLISSKVPRATIHKNPSKVSHLKSVLWHVSTKSDHHQVLTVSFQQDKEHNTARNNTHIRTRGTIQQRIKTAVSSPTILTIFGRNMQNTFKVTGFQKVLINCCTQDCRSN
jgi:hypothetical protein